MQPGEDDPCRTITPVPTGGSPLLRDNGRTLTDEASDAFLAILTNRKVAEDKVFTAPRARVPWLSESER